MDKKEIIDSEKISSLLSYGEELFPCAKCELNYSKDYELVIAVMLSAQTTDAAVNNVTKILFSKYPTIYDLQRANISDIENIIKPIGLFKNKAKNIKNIVNSLINDFNCRVPEDKKSLQKLQGVGNKTAGVIRAELFNIPDLPVDTHILRVTKRLDIVGENASPIDVENTLKKIIPEEKWIQSHHTLIFFGRYFCTAKKPNCSNCKIREKCIKNPIN